MEQLTKNQAVATSQEAVQNQNEPQLRDENAHNDKSVHGVDRKSGSAGMPRPISYAVFCLKKKKKQQELASSRRQQRVRKQRDIESVARPHTADPNRRTRYLETVRHQH